MVRSAAIAFSLMTTALVVRHSATARQSEWRTDYAAALAEAKQTGKPLFVVIR